MTTATPTLIEAATALDRFLAPAREAWDDGRVVHLAICPGDGTSYRMTFVPSSPWGFATTWTSAHGTFSESHAVPDPDRLLVVHGPSRAIIPLAERSEPWPSYASEKLGTDNRWTVLAVGLAWWLMAGNSPADAAMAYQDLTVAGGGLPNPLTQWDLDRFATPAVVA